MEGDERSRRASRAAACTARDIGAFLFLRVLFLVVGFTEFFPPRVGLPRVSSPRKKGGSLGSYSWSPFILGAMHGPNEEAVCLDVVFVV